MKRVAVALAILLGACRPDPIPPLDPTGLPPRADDDIPSPNPVVPATDVDARACLRLAELQCPEAMNGCLSAFSAARTDGRLVPATCIAGSLTVEDVRACGDASTLTVECKK